MEVDERVTLVDYTASPQGINLPIPADSSCHRKGTTGEWVHILKSPDLADLKVELESVYKSGIKSLAVCW